MKVLGLVKDEAGGIPWPTIGFGLLSAGGGCGVIVVASSAALHAGHPVYLAWHFAGYLLAVGIYLVAFRQLVRNTIGIFDRVVERYKNRLAGLIRRADARKLEVLEPERVRARITGELTVLEQTAEPLATSVNTLAVWLCSSVYLLLLSPLGFVVVAVVILFGFRHSLRRLRRVEPIVRHAEDEAELMHERLARLLHGLRELKLDWQKDASYSDSLRDIVRSMIGARKKEVSALELLRRDFHLSYYVALGFVVFVLPQYAAGLEGMIAKFASILIFALGPLALLTLNLSRLALADVAINRLRELEDELAQTDVEGRPVTDRFAGFKELALAGVEFKYGDSVEDHFQVGPVDLKIGRGETVFIVGGNGSGKSSLSKLLLGLYLPERGSLQIDGSVVNEHSRDDYRALFTFVSATPYLFSAPFGFSKQARAELPGVIERMGLKNITELDENNRFRNLELSSGQRMRLALGLARLEDRPVYVFDEPAANLDPEFREQFYREILPALKLEQKTTIVITHDDQYFELADRVVEMADGRLADEPLSQA